ncbi:hypothetical protein STIAU_1485 [Stigmatella aurantiaca DW4/3-1]|uniref:Uncharacterized protein n=1 Tax=Stigmatella aurantiaca (strain DW4/3-1) TaxID=378806 RepID=Q09DK0_STIAD|nr:hypothetical protein STIAU_1485 [Stigmatella aurantiaca DW4/3-1]
MDVVAQALPATFWQKFDGGPGSQATWIGASVLASAATSPPDVASCSSGATPQPAQDIAIARRMNLARSIFMISLLFLSRPHQRTWSNLQGAHTGSNETSRAHSVQTLPFQTRLMRRVVLPTVSSQVSTGWSFAFHFRRGFEATESVFTHACPSHWAAWRTTFG